MRELRGMLILLEQANLNNIILRSEDVENINMIEWVHMEDEQTL